jgi:hypothetical protein
MRFMRLELLQLLVLMDHGLLHGPHCIFHDVFELLRVARSLRTTEQSVPSIPTSLGRLSSSRRFTIEPF